MPRRSLPPAHSAHEQLVVVALTDEREGLTLNEIRERCGGSVAQSSLALMSLEAQGRGVLSGGRWRLRTRLF